jgi:endonuclease/exonuclease/phosphatase family metal-dependent hydrolase
VNPVGLRCADRARIYVAVLAAAAGCAVALAVTACGGVSGTATAVPRPAASAYTLMQMNLCLSGIAGCYPMVDYPAGVQDAVGRIREARPDAVTLNEACSGDAALIARRTGYHLRFARVIYNRKLLPCITPGDRGLFGNAVLSKAAIESSESHAFGTQAGPERREWLCVSTRVGVEVCTAQLASPAIDEAAANAPQCAELRAILARRARTHTVIFGGDVNRLSSCAPRGFWTRTDRSARQDPGSQQVYGTRALRSPAAQVVPATHTDHDVLLVRARLMPSR